MKKIFALMFVAVIGLGSVGCDDKKPTTSAAKPAGTGMSK